MAPYPRDPQFSFGPPSLSARGGLYTLTFQPAYGNVVVDVSRIKESSRGDVTAEFRIKGRPIGAGVEVGLRSRLNMLSATTKRGTAKELFERGPDYLDDGGWRTLIEMSCDKVLDLHRQGAPAVDMATHELTYSGPRYRIGPLLEERQATVLFGDGGSGKSMMAAALGQLVVTGRDHAGLKPHIGSVLYADYETDVTTTTERVKLLAAGFDSPPSKGFHYLSMVQIFAADFDRINRVVRDNNVKLVIVDSAAMATGEPESADATAQYFRALAGLDTTTLTIAHVAKAGREREPFGSIFWRNAPRSIYRALSGHSGATLHMGLRHTKSNNGTLQPDRAYNFTFSDDRVTVKQSDPLAIENMESGAPLRVRIERLLSNGPMSPAKISEELAVKDGNVRSTLRRLKARGKVLALDTGEYELPPLPLHVT